MNQNDEATELEQRKDRRFSVSANRGNASHRVRYVETGGAAVDTDECTFCQSVPDLDHEGEVKETEVTAICHPKEGQRQGE